MSGFGFSLSKYTSLKIFILADLDPDVSAGIYPGWQIAWVFREPSNLDPHTSRLQTKTQFITSLSCDFKSDITKPNYRKIFVSAGMAPNLSAIIDYFQVIIWVFREPFILNRSCHNFGKGNKWRKLNSQLWIRKAGYLNYILSIYVFSLYFVSLTKYEAKKLNNMMWLRMAVKLISIYLLILFFWSFLVSWLPGTGHGFSEMWMQMAGEFIYYSSS